MASPAALRLLHHYGYPTLADASRPQLMYIAAASSKQHIFGFFIWGARAVFPQAAKRESTSGLLSQCQWNLSNNAPNELS